MCKPSLIALLKVGRGPLTVTILLGIGLVFSGCTMPTTISPSQPSSILQIARAVGQREASLEDLMVAAAKAGDSALTIQPQPNPALCAIDQNDDLYIDAVELLAAIQAWAEGTPIGGYYIDSVTLLEAIVAWANRMRLVCGSSVTNRPPIADLNLLATYCDPMERACYALLEAEGSYDPDGWIAGFRVDCGGGWLISGELSAIVCEYPYRAAAYTVTLTVIDDKGASSQASLRVSFTADPCAHRTGYVHRTYRWRYRLVEYTWEVDLPDYLICRSEHADVPRSGSFPYSEFWELVDWPEDDEWIRALAQSLNDVETVTDYYSLATNTLHFVQGMMPYRYDEYAYDVGDYWALPFETLDRQAGDCEDGTILYVSLMRALGYPVYFGVYPYHAFAFVEVSKDWVDAHTTPFNKCLRMGAWTIAVSGGRYYAMAETTIDPSIETLGYWGLGCGRIPEEYWDQGLVRIIYPVTGLDVTSEFKLLKPSLHEGD